MSEQTREALIAKLRKVAVCIHIAAESTVADDVEKTCLAAAEMLAAPPVATDGWQPISTAPKAGDLLLWIPPSTTGKGYMTIGHYVAFFSVPPNGYRSGWCNGWDGRYLDEEPTHWMPLPPTDAPQEKV